MEGIQVYNFKVSSSIHDYEVQFIEDTKIVLMNELKEGDFIIIDSKVKELYFQDFQGILNSHKHISIEPTEAQKSYQGVMPVIDQLIVNGFRKNHRLIGIGGGITQDVVAFISSILYRGVSWLFFPTTLLAQGDSCIGSKTSINFNEFKNQIGGFYPPSKIFINVRFLDTLPESQLRSGLGEMCHYFIVSGEYDFKRFKSDYPAALIDKDILTGLIARSLEIKKGYVEIDEFDRKERMVFNYGHTFGHAIESLTNYSIQHGIAVSYGMDISNFISVKLNYIPERTRMEIRELLQTIWAGTDISGISVEKYKIALSKDKKNVSNQLGLILNKGYGNIVKELRPMDSDFTRWLNEYFTNELNFKQ